MKLFQVVASALALGGLHAAIASPLSGSAQLDAAREESKRSLPSTDKSKHLRYDLERRQTTQQQVPDTDVEGYAEAGFAQGQPISGSGRGAPFSGKLTR